MINHLLKNLKIGLLNILKMHQLSLFMLNLNYGINHHLLISIKKRKKWILCLKHNIAYAKKASYHNMCRFYLGQFYNVPELSKYKYYWRIEPQVKFFTSIDYDVFKYMEDTGKIYGFTINLYDIEESIKTLWPETLTYLNENDNYKYIDPNGSFQWLLEDLQNPKKNQVANGYSTCHFWSNFEIGDMDFSEVKLIIIGLNILIQLGNSIMKDGEMLQFIQLVLVYLLQRIKSIGLEILVMNMILIFMSKY